MILEIPNKEDRKIVAAILVDNGYTVKAVKIKQGSVTKTCLSAEKNNKEVGK